MRASVYSRVWHTVGITHVVVHPRILLLSVLPGFGILPWEAHSHGKKTKTSRESTGLSFSSWVISDLSPTMPRDI